MCVFSAGGPSSQAAEPGGASRRELRLLGEKATRRGDHTAAIEVWNRLLADRPNDLELLLRLGCSQSLLCRYDEAEKTFRKGLAQQPGHAPLMYNLALMFFRKGQLDKTERYLKQALALDPKLPGVNEHLALLCEQRGDKASARRYYLREINQNPGSLNAWQWALRRKENQPRRDVSATFAIGFFAACLALCAVLWLVAWRRRRAHGDDADEHWKPNGLPSPTAGE